MENLFFTVLGMSGTAAIVILAVLLARLALRKAPKVFSYALWAVVLFRLLCPLTIESAFSLIPTAQVADVPGRGEEPAQVIRVQTGLPAVDRQVNGFFIEHPYQGQPALPEDGLAVPVPPIQQSGAVSDWRTVPAAVWLAGAAALLGYSMTALLRLRRRLIGCVPLAGEKNVLLADRIPSPFVLGVFRPKIYLPSDLPECERDYILLHERTHIRRGDHIFRALAWAALAVHWFNPLVWLAFRLAGRDMEMSCDEAVLGKMGRDVRADYCASLLRISAGGKLPEGPLAFGDGEPQGRIKNVLNYKKPALWMLVLALAAVVCAGAALATSRTVDAPGIDLKDLTADLTFSLVEGSGGQYVRMEGSVGDTVLERGASWHPEAVWGKHPYGELSLVYPAFTQGIEGNIAAWWADGDRTSVTISTLMTAMFSSYIHSGYWVFTVDLTQNGGTVTGMVPQTAILAEGQEDAKVVMHPESISDEEAVNAARVVAKLLTAAEDFYANAQLPVSPNPALPDGLTFSDGWYSSVSIGGLDVQEMYWYSPDRYYPQGQLFFTNPVFLGPAFEGRTVHGNAQWTDESHTCVRIDWGWDNLTYLDFTVDLDSGTVMGSAVWDGLTDGDLLAVARTLGLLMEQAEAYKTSGGYRPPEEGPLPFERPMELEFASGAGAWRTNLLLHPDGSFEGDYSDSDMDIQYVCRFHGRFGDITPLTAASYAMTLEELVLDTGRPVGEEWDAGGIHYISSEPYGFNSLDGQALEPGAQFMFYTPEAKGYAPTDELYGMRESGDYDSIMYEFWTWWPDKHGWESYGDTLGCYGLCNMEAGYGFFGLDA